MAELKVGDTVRNTTNGTLFVVVALPTADDARLTVHYSAAPSVVKHVDPKDYVREPQKLERQQREGLDRMERGGRNRAR